MEWGWGEWRGPGLNLSYSIPPPSVTSGLLIGLMSLFQCGLPKETPILKNVLFCVV